MRQLILIFLLGCAACTTQAHDPARGEQSAAAAPISAPVAGPAPVPGAGGETVARIRSLIGEASCTESAQCRSLPIGAVACGGPQGYLPYSLSRTDEKALRALAEQYKAERQAEIKASGLVSTCRYLPDPGAVCTSGSCQLGASSPAAR